MREEYLASRSFKEEEIGSGGGRDGEELSLPSCHILVRDRRKWMKVKRKKNAMLILKL